MEDGEPSLQPSVAGLGPAVIVSVGHLRGTREKGAGGGYENKNGSGGRNWKAEAKRTDVAAHDVNGDLDTVDRLGRYDL